MGLHSEANIGLGWTRLVVNKTVPYSSIMVFTKIRILINRVSINETSYELLTIIIWAGGLYHERDHPFIG
jgi:hypothetical protein